MQRLSEVFEQPCKICGCKMEIVKELENINDISRGYMRTTVLCRCKNEHEDVRELEFDVKESIFSASVYRKEEWEQSRKQKKNQPMDNINPMRVLVACEESQEVCKAFRVLGHEAYSADIQEPSGGHPEWHVLGDVLPIINGECTFTTMDGKQHRFGHPYSKRTCLWLKGLPPLKPTEIIENHEPYVNGGCKDAHGNYRRFQGRKERDPKTRAKTFPGIAKAMAEQWGGKCNG